MSQGCYKGYDYRDKDYGIDDMCYESQADADLVGEDLHQYGEGIPEEDMQIIDEEPMLDGDFAELDDEDLENFDPDVGDFPDEDFADLEGDDEDGEGLYEEGAEDEMNEDSDEFEDMYEEEGEEIEMDD